MILSSWVSLYFPTLNGGIQAETEKKKGTFYKFLPILFFWLTFFVEALLGCITMGTPTTMYTQCYIRARLDCLTKPSDVMHLTNILNTFSNF